MDADRVNVIKGRAPLRAGGAVRSALAQRGHGVGSISYVYSPKNDRDFVLPTDIELLHFLHLEASSEVQSYDLDPERVVAHVAGRGYVASKPDAVVQLFSGGQRLVKVKYQVDLDNDIRAAAQVAVQKQAAEKIGAEWSAYTDTMAQAEDRLLHDWLQIVITLTQTSPYLNRPLEDRVLDVLDARGQITLGEARALDTEPWSLVFSTLFRLCQKGQLTEDLSVNHLSSKTLISRVFS